MGLAKFLAKLFKCSSNCNFNFEDLADDLLDIDLRQYQLTEEDLRRIEKIQRKRPSIHNYKHSLNKNNPDKIQVFKNEITQNFNSDV